MRRVELTAPHEPHVLDPPVTTAEHLGQVVCMLFMMGWFVRLLLGTKVVDGLVRRGEDRELFFAFGERS